MNSLTDHYGLWRFWKVVRWIGFWVGVIAVCLFLLVALYFYLTYDSKLEQEVRTQAFEYGITFSELIDHGLIQRDSASRIVSVTGNFRGLVTAANRTVRLPVKPEGLKNCTIAPGGEGLFFIGHSYPQTFYCRIPPDNPYDGAIGKGIL